MITRRKALILISALAAPLLAAKKSTETGEKININTATAKDLETLPGIGPKRAEIIIKMREKNGPFRGVEELRAVPRLPERDFLKLRDLVTVSDSPDKPR